MIICYHLHGPIEDTHYSGRTDIDQQVHGNSVKLMNDEFSYHCEDCGKYSKGNGEEAPECCEKKMERLPMNECVKDPGFAEHARNFEDDEPCDPGH